MANWLVTDGKLFAHQFQDDDVPGLGAELAYRFLFAIFPFGIFVAALSAFVANTLGMENPTDKIMSGIGDNLPQNLAGPIKDQLQSILGQNQPGLLSFGAILALYAATGGTNALMKAMNRAYDVSETRPFLLRYGYAALLTILGGFGIILSFVTVVGGALLTQDLVNRLGIGSAWNLVSLLRWPIVFAILTLAVAIIFRYAPNVRPPWRWTILGAAAFAVLWLAVTFVFGFYVSNFGHYNATYGAIAGVIVLMLWFYLTSIVLVSCAELVSVLVRTHSPELLEARRSEVGSAAKREVERLEEDAEAVLRRRREREEQPADAPSTDAAVEANQQSEVRSPASLPAPARDSAADEDEGASPAT